jgi:hypothetical protein
MKTQTPSASLPAKRRYKIQVPVGQFGWADLKFSAGGPYRTELFASRRDAVNEMLSMPDGEDYRVVPETTKQDQDLYD